MIGCIIHLTYRYGGVLANFNLKSFVKLVDTYDELKDTDIFLKGSCLRDFKVVDQLDLHEEMVKSDSRNFSIDLIPKVIFSKSKSVNY